ncbi:LysR family transcriptional regulator [Desulfovibrio sp. OttesenSCG-928-M16]|nr:LysR family transcriptional regulator [Desulfovibrio sp. OttesenSCG-928-M16]
MNRYTVFTKILDTGSFSRAAEELGYTQSAVSQIIKSLEEEFSTTLLVRSRSGISLTANGEELLPYIRAICGAERKLKEKQKEMLGLGGGVIRIGTIASVSCNWLPGLMQGFKEKYPDVQFFLQQQLTYTGVAKLIREGSVDFGFVKTDVADGLHSIPLTEDAMMAVLPVTHALASENTIPLEHLVQEPFILMEAGQYNEVIQYIETHNQKLNIQYRVFDDYTIMAMVENNMGVGILPELILRRRGYNVAVRPLHPPLYRYLGVAYREHGLLPLAARYFIDYIADCNAAGYFNA